MPCLPAIRLSHIPPLPSPIADLIFIFLNKMGRTKTRTHGVFLPGSVARKLEARHRTEREIQYSVEHKYCVRGRSRAAQSAAARDQPLTQFICSTEYIVDIKVEG